MPEAGRDYQKMEIICKESFANAPEKSAELPAEQK